MRFFKKFLICVGILVVLPCSGMEMPLFDAIKQRDLGRVQELINQDSLVSQRDAELNTPLHMAVKQRDEAIVAALLAKGANPHETNGDDVPAYGLAVIDDMPEIAEQYLRTTEKLTLSDFINFAWMQSLTRDTNITIPFFRKILLFGRYDPELLDSFVPHDAYEKVLVHILQGGGEAIQNIAQLFESNPNLIVTRDPITGASLLMYAATLGRLSAVQYLLGKNANTLIKDDYDTTLFDRISVLMSRTDLSAQERKNYETIVEYCKAQVRATAKPFIMAMKKWKIPYDLIRGPLSAEIIGSRYSELTFYKKSCQGKLAALPQFEALLLQADKEVAARNINASRPVGIQMRVVPAATVFSYSGDLLHTLCSKYCENALFVVIFAAVFYYVTAQDKLG